MIKTTARSCPECARADLRSCYGGERGEDGPFLSCDQCGWDEETWPTETTAPGHTDLMVSPESLDAWLDANPPPDQSESTMPINMTDPISDPDAWDADRLAQEVAFTISPAGRLRREDREIAFALEIERLRAALSHVRDVLRDKPDAWPSWDGETGKIIREAMREN